MVSVVASSRLRLTPLVVVEGVEHWDLWDAPRFSERSDDLRHVVQRGDRLDLIAYDYYGSPVLWWVVAEANRLDLPHNIADGMVLRIPSPALVARMISGRI